MDDVAGKTRAQIHSNVLSRLPNVHPALRDFTNWRNYCHVVAPAIISAYDPDAHTCVMRSRTEERATYHVLVVDADDRVLDVAYCWIACGVAPADAPDSKPFLGTRAQWGKHAGFDATQCESPIEYDPVTRFLAR